MRNKALLLIAAALLLAVGTVTAGSNMGFKITIPLTVGYQNYVSLPYYNSYTNASSLFSDIPNCTAVKRWDNLSGTFQQWSGTRGTNFTITPGEAYIVDVSASTNWIVVGSHNPSLSVTLTAGYQNYVSVPYHTTATNAQTLFNDIANCTAVKRWDNPTGNMQQWSGTRGVNFTLIPGEGLIIDVRANTSWIPSHN